jgi:hypothetical protein
MQPTYRHRIIGLLLILNCCFIVHANERPGTFTLSGGCITSATQYILYNSIPAAITATAASGGSCTTYSYQWQKSTDNIYFTDIPGATNQNLSFTTTLPQTPPTMYFQRKTICGNEVAYTGSVAVNMIAKFYYNVADTSVFTRTCSTGGTPQPYTYIVRANKYSSPFSQQDADAKAQKDLTDSGLYYANLKGVCLWYNVEKRDTLNRNDCGSGFGSSYIYIVRARKYSSAVSQPDADAKAQKDINDSTQYYANRLGTCTWYNLARDSTTTKKDCPAGTTPTNFKYIVAARKYSSVISQADADAKAGKDINDSTQLKANANGLCQNLFISMRSGGSDPNYFTISVANSSGVVVYQKTAFDGASMLPIAVALPASSYYTVTVGSPGIMYTIVNGSRQQMTNNSSTSFTASNVIKVEVSGSPLYYSAYAAGIFIKSCPEGYAGNTVTYSVYDGKYTSSLNQPDADAKATKEVSDSGQVYANRVGTCTLSQLVNITLTNYFPSGTPPTMSVTFLKDNVAVKTSSFPTTGTGSLGITLPAGTYTMTFSCPGAPDGMPLGWKLRPQDFYWSKPYNLTTVTTGAVTFVYGTAYTIMANRDL